MTGKKLCGLAVLAAGLCGGLGTAAAQDTPGEADEDMLERVPMAISGKQRFMVRGLDGGENAELGQWAEGVADRIEAIIGFPLPFSVNQRIVLSCSESPLNQPAKALPQQRMTEYFLMQKLYIFGYDRLDKETLLDRLTWLLLNRYAIAKQPRETRRVLLSQVPAWFSIGCARQLQEELYADNPQATLAAWPAGEVPRLGDVLAYGDLQPDQLAERTACGLAFGWLSSRPDFQELVPPLFSRWGVGEPVDTNWLITRLPDVANPLELEKHWDLWLAHAGKVDRAWVMSPAEQIHRLKSMMVIRPATLKIPYPADAPEALTWEDLLDITEASWFTPLVAKLKWEVLFVSMGPQPGFAEVVDGYAEYLDQLLNSKDRKHFSGGSPRRKMLKMLEEAHDALNRYERLYLMRRSYLDQFDEHKQAVVRPGSAAGSPSAVRP